MTFLSARRAVRSHGKARLAALLSAILVAAGLTVGLVTTSATAATGKINLRALVVDDGSNWVKGIADQFDYEGLPYSRVRLSDTGRPTIDAGFLASGNDANFNAVVVPNDAGGGLPAAESSALAVFEAQFGVRQVNGYDWANPSVGLNYADSPGYVGDLAGMTGTVTAAGQGDGFGFLSGSVPIGVGSYGYLATPATTAMPAGGSYTPLITVPIPGSNEVGSLVGVYAKAGVEKLIITGAMTTELSHWRIMAHGIVSWVTKGVHFGYNRNYMTFQFDDTFSYDARWDSVNNCTPGEDCPASVTTVPPAIRMTPADVSAVVGWQNNAGYRLTMPFNAYHTAFDAEGAPLTSPDPLTTAFVANKDAFSWLNHGYQHIYQGCVQDFTVVPWRCVLTSGTTPAADGSNISWTGQAVIGSEIADDISRGQALGLSFDPQEYLSGEHSGLFLTPQQPVDNPNFTAALSAAGIRYIGADASREPGARVVGGATTVPRHPVAVYYNASTVAEEVDEYNWFYNTRANGGSGYCEDNPATATCLTVPLTTADFTGHIVPTDASNDLRFITSNDPRPFYAHVSNLTGPDYLGLTLIDAILTRYRASFSTATPPVNLTLTQASDILTKQQGWATNGMAASPAVTGYLENGTVKITNPTGAPAPLTVPPATTVNGTPFGESYGGERSGWINGNATVAVSQQPPAFTSAVTETATVGSALSFQVTTTGNPAATITQTGTLPSGITFTANADGTATLAGTPAAGSGGTYPLTFTATNPAGTVTQDFSLSVNETPAFTSANGATATVGAAFTFQVTTKGTPSATLTQSGKLPSGITFALGANGTATLAGTPATGSGGSYPLTLTATNSAGTVNQTFSLIVNGAPTFTSVANATATAGQAFSFTVTTSGYPAATITRTGTLPSGITFTAGSNGTATLAGTPGSTVGGAFTQTFTARNSFGTVTQTFVLTVQRTPAITSSATGTATVGTTFTKAIASNGFPTPTVTVTGLPAGLTFTPNTNGGGTISGTPAADTGGVKSVTVTSTNAAGAATQTLTLTVRQAPAITSPASFTATRGQAFTFTVTTAGYPTPNLGYTGTLPAGVRWTNNRNGTATISGTATTAVTRTLTIQTWNVVSTVNQTFILTIQ
jgi:hypothetical protein